MSWQTRGTRKYYYRSVRIGDRVVRQYLGSGPMAEAAAAEIQSRHERGVADLQMIEKEVTRTYEAVALSRRLEQRCSFLTEAVLLSLGFHQTNSGPWRVRRHASKIQSVDSRDNRPEIPEGERDACCEGSQATDFEAVTIDC
ncbi:hypothetical protein SH661x_002881 [Planctomicrobium sp. SH661]|uniref:hypothetical protein n=1 Tax=Planctomicrobium sp. SH661 TaxID=3448124 RepID=UPI003F5C5838